ncbi:MAG: lytic transglycosylase domain-containing protein [Lentisphaerae bacterium]|nr:lytic transglycosylase domain-containing protein [Lentisphaerota bacterium]
MPPTRQAVVLAAIAAALLCLAALPGSLTWRRWRQHARAESFDDLIETTARRHGLAPALVKAVVWKESRFQIFCVGRANEIGLMQITEGAVKDWSDARGIAPPSRCLCFDPGLNLEIGTWYLARAMRTWKDYRSADVLALAEYNAGGSRARAWAPANPQQELAVSQVSFSSTRHYIVEIKSKWHDFEQARQSLQ